MADVRPDSLFDDLFEGDTILEPVQLAVHGLLCVYYEIQAGTRTSRADEIIDRLPAVPWPGSVSLRMPSMRWMIGLAATLAIVAGLLWFRTGGSSAFAGEIQRLATLAPPPGRIELYDPRDTETVDLIEARIAALREDLAALITAGEDPWTAWTQLYRNLRSIGRWEEAIAEMEAFAKYAEQRDRLPDGYSMYYTVLADLGNTYAAMSDYETALAFHLRALEVRRDYQEWFFRTGQAADSSALAYARAMSNTLAPQFWALAQVAVGMGDLSTAASRLDEAEAVMLDYFRLESEARGLASPSPSPLTKGGERGVVESAQVRPASPRESMPDQVLAFDPALRELYSLTLNLLPVTDKGVESQVIKVREHLLRRATLLRMQRQPDAALRVFDLARAIGPYERFAYADESRLDFFEPFEETYIHLARGDFSAALAAAEQADLHTGPVEVPGYPPHPPIGLLPRAELTFLRGVAETLLDPKDVTVADAAKSALKDLEDFAAALPDRQRSRLMDRFAEWEKALELATGQLQPAG